MGKVFLLTPPMKMEQTECSETSAYKIQMPGNHPKERIQQAKKRPQSESLLTNLCKYRNINNLDNQGKHGKQ